MELKNKLYKNIGIHVLSTLFTVDKGVVKILLVKRTNNPYNGYWALPSGALYNNELLEVGAKRELKEKTGIDNVNLEMVGVFDKLDRSNLARMIGISFLGVIDINKVVYKVNRTISYSIVSYFSIMIACFIKISIIFLMKSRNTSTFNFFILIPSHLIVLDSVINHIRINFFL